MPLKSFSRSKCVSKSWQALLSHNYVRNKLPLIVSGVFQPSSSTSKTGPVYLSASDDAHLYPAQLDSNRVASTLIDCCNGLLLFYSSVASCFSVCNPTTNKHVTLPKPSEKTKLSVLAFDPCHSHHFRVISFTGWRAQSADLEVFCSDSGAWVTHTVDWGIDTNALSATIRYMDGTLYILAQPDQVVALDLDSMACDLIELPEPISKECCIAKVGGRLCYSSCGDGERVRVWMLEDDDEWMLKHCVSIKMGQFRVLALDPERDGVVYLCVEGRLVAYDLCEERVEGSWELGEENKGYLIQAWVFPFSKYLEDCLAN